MGSMYRGLSKSPHSSAWGMGMLVACGAVLRLQGHADGHVPCTDGGLYTATRYEFRSLPDIRRNLHQRPLKTEESPLHWLNGETSPSHSYPVAGIMGCGTLHCPGECGAGVGDGCGVLCDLL